MNDEANALREDILAIASITGPVPLEVVSEVTRRPLDDVATEADRLASENLLTIDRSGVSDGLSSMPQGRRTVLATRLADALAERGADEVRQAEARWEAGDAAAAHALFRAATTSAGPDDRTDLIDAAIETGRAAGVAPEELADLLVIRARHRRNRGEGAAARADLDAAMPHLEGNALIDALAFAAAIEDDLQHPADAERTVALAMAVAAESGAFDKLGSLSTFHGRVLSRVGFDREADDAFDRGLELVESHGTTTQQFYASINRAWTDLDRGWVQRAENRFTVARDRAAEVEDSVSAADKEIYLARAKFGTGDVTGALSSLERGRAVAEETGAVALDFLATIAEAEGDVRYRRREAALDSTARLQQIVEVSFPSWANRSATLRARALLLNGDRIGARTVIGSGLAATPPGANGLRLRTELEALQMAASDSWDAERAADVGDRLVQSGWLGTAAWFLTERATREKDPNLGRIAAAMAHRLGDPMLAAGAIEAADTWDEPEAGPVSLAIQRVARSIPDAWVEEWRSLPEVSHALDVEFEQVTATDADLLAGLDAALAAAGLGGTDTVLSPAQRRAQGLVTGSPSRVSSITRWLAPLVGAAVVAAVVAIAFAPDPVEIPPPVMPPPATFDIPTTIPELPDTQIPAPDLQGQSPFAGGETRNARYDYAIGEPEGFYWRRTVTGFVRNDPVLRGKNLYVGTSEGWVSAMDVSNGGASTWEDQFGGAIESSFASDLVSFEQGGTSRPFVFFSSADGVLTMRNVDDQGGVAWEVDLDSPTVGPPLVRNDYVIAATEDGAIVKLDGSDGSEIARFPTEGTVPGGFVHPLASSNGILYAPAAEGVVLLVDEETMTEECRVEIGAGSEITTHPVIADGRWFVGTTNRAIFAYAEGGCSPGGGAPAFNIDVPIEFAPVIVDGVMWAPADELLMPLDITDNSGEFVIPLEGRITSPPVVVGDLILVGVISGSENQLIAVSMSNRDIPWIWPLDGALRTRPVVGDGVVIVATDQEVVAIAVPSG